MRGSCRKAFSAYHLARLAIFSLADASSLHQASLLEQAQSIESESDSDITQRMSSIESLNAVGRETACLFDQFVNVTSVSSKHTDAHISPEKANLEYERFNLWAGNLGLYQLGHSSLDYRLRDADSDRSYVLDILHEINEHLTNILEIVEGKRRPLEDVDIEEYESHDVEQDFPHESIEYRKNSTASNSDHGNISQTNSDLGEAEDENFSEVLIRFESLTDRIDSLYKLATRIRNPATRQHRSIDELYKHVPSNERAALMKERENIESLMVKHFLAEDLAQLEPSSAAKDPVIPMTMVECHALTESVPLFLVRRVGIANARRRQQFIYWREHAQRISSVKSPKQTRRPSILATKVDETRQPGLGLPSEVSHSKSATQPSDPTSASTYNRRPDTSSSIRSTSSRISSISKTDKDFLAWPTPPKRLPPEDYFECPYCKVICPGDYTNEKSWRKHIVHDLQPYSCTYEECSDGNHTYNSRTEWIKHETALHASIWQCSEHPAEGYKSRQEYLDHLNWAHSEDSCNTRPLELLASEEVVSSDSLRPCPFCGAASHLLDEIQSHIASHMERFALLTLPRRDDIEEEDVAEGASCDSNHAAMQIGDQARADSRAGDFDTAVPLTFVDSGQAADEILASDNTVTSSRLEDMTLTQYSDKVPSAAADRNETVIQDTDVALSSSRWESDREHREHDGHDQQTSQPRAELTDNHILSFDAGGVRTYSSLLILDELLAYVDKVLRQENATRTTNQAYLRTADCFSMIGGSSTGGLAALMVGRLGMSSQNALAEYRQFLKAVYKEKKIFTIHKYDRHALESWIKSRLYLSEIALLEEASTNESKCKTALFAVRKNPATGDELCIFRSYEYTFPNDFVWDVFSTLSWPKWPHGDWELPISQIIYAACASPNFFPTIEIDGERFMDAGIRVNNPSFRLWQEESMISKAQGSQSGSHGIMVNIGSGKGTPLNLVGNPFFRTIMRIARSDFKLSDPELAHDFMKSIYEDRKLPYFRFNVQSGFEDIALDDVRDETLSRIKTVTRAYLQQPEVRTRMRECAQLLVRHRRLGSKTPEVVPERFLLNDHVPERSLLDDPKIRGTLLKGGRSFHDGEATRNTLAHILKT